MKALIFTSAALILVLSSNARAVDGKEVYAKKCASCHGKDGKGDTKMGKKLKIQDLTINVSKLSDADMKKAITEGVVVDGKKRMKAVKGLTGEDVAAVIAYTKTL